MIQIQEQIISLSKKDTYKVSAIISTYNSEKFIAERLNNLLEQSIIDELEIVIVNSNSMENEDDIIRTFLKYDNITYIITDQTETIYKAWNRAIAYSKGKFITNANTDDRLKRNALEIMVEVLEKNKNVGLVYANQFIVDDPIADINTLDKHKSSNRIKFDRLNLLYKYFFGSQPMWRASIHKEHNLWFNDHLEVAGDYQFALELVNFYDIKYIPDILGSYYLSKTGANKEFSTGDKNIKEAVFLQYEYARKYFNSLSKRERYLYIIKFSLIYFIPDFLYRACRKFFTILFPKKEPIHKSYYHFFLAILLENTDLQTRKNLVIKYHNIGIPIIDYFMEQLNDR